MRSSDALLACLTTSLLAAGCFEPIDHTGRECPCASGYQCDPVTERCVADGLDTGTADDGGARDGGRDASALDAFAFDAFDPSIDAPTFDSPTPDAALDDDAFAFDAHVPGADAFAVDAFGVDAFSRDAFVVPDAFARDAFVVPDAGFVPCPAGILLCDDFESAVSTRVPPWGYYDGLAARSTERAYRGSASGRFAIAEAGETQSLGKSVATPAEVWIRGRLLVRPRMSMARRDVAFFHVGDDTAPGYDNVSFVVGDDSAGLLLGTYNTSSGVYHPGITIPDDTWICIAAHVRTGAMGLVELYAGTTRAVSFAESVVFAGGGIRVVDVGITYSGDSTSAVTLHLDDVAVSTTIPLLCD
ncbi:MAG: hypothetical protein J0L92_15835 [Deltaproteobacteria bacterium]|nr:hypothetical protein [Deltaproteobacteria bacterium]